MTPRRLIEPARLAGSAVLRTQSDDRLVDLVRDGNDRAFEAIVHRYREPLLRYCRRFLSPARAEDAVQQTFVNAVAAIRAADADITLRPWLYRIAHNAALNVMRQAGADHEEISEQIDGVETPPQALERGERLRTVVAAVRDLPDRQRDALVLQALEGRSYDEIAVELGVTGGAVRQLLNRARTTLREGVTALTPPALAARLGGALDVPMAASAGGAAALAKVAAVVAATTALVGGAADGILPHGGHHRAASSHASKPAPRVAMRPVTTPKPRHDPAPTPTRVATRPRPASRPVRHGQSHRGEPLEDHASAPRHEETRSGNDGGGSSPTTVLTPDDHSGSGDSGSDGPSGSDDIATTTPLTATSSSDSSSGGSDDGGTSGGPH